MEGKIDMKPKARLFVLGCTLLAGGTLAKPAAAQNREAGVISISGVRYTGYKVVSGNNWEIRTCLGNRVAGSQLQPSDHPKAFFQPGSVHCTTSASASSVLDSDGNVTQDPADVERTQLAKLPK